MEAKGRPARGLVESFEIPKGASRNLLVAVPVGGNSVEGAQ